MDTKNQSIGIIGVGMVGGALKRYFEEMRGYERGVNLFLYDLDPRKGYQDDVNRSGVIFVAVPTPRSADGGAELDAVILTLEKMSGSKIAVLKSTIPPGTTEMLQKRFPRHRLLFNPEFLTEARAWENMTHPDRQLVGWTSASRAVAREVLSLLPSASLIAPSENFELTATEAEIIKYAANCFLTRKVTFANALHDLAMHHGVRYEHIRKAVGADLRIGASHLDVHHDGYRGYGGYCFVKDTDALIAHCRSQGLEELARFFESDRIYNEQLLKSQGLTPEDVSVHDDEWSKGLLHNDHSTAIS